MLYRYRHECCAINIVNNSRFSFGRYKLQCLSYTKEEKKKKKVISNTRKWRKKYITINLWLTFSFVIYANCYHGYLLMCTGIHVVTVIIIMHILCYTKLYIHIYIFLVINVLVLGSHATCSCSFLFNRVHKYTISHIVCYARIVENIAEWRIP